MNHLYNTVKLMETENNPYTKEERLEVMIPLLCHWYEENKRELPWRSNPLPYWVWISEIMLQQTRVEAVKPYFKRFMETLPTIKELAEAEEDVLLKLWEGLGYYSRIRNIQKTAILCMEQYNGELPSTYEELIALPGIGSYTAGAISSIAYKQLVPAVDGNVLRVITRLTADNSDITKQSVKTKMEQQLKRAMESVKPNSSTFNQGLMELGATVCIPNGAPLCYKCPWEEICLAKKNNLIGEIPNKPKKKQRKIEKKTVFVVEDNGYTIIRKREDKGLLAGLYELINVEGHLTMEEAQHFWENQLGVTVTIWPLPSAKHIFSHVEWHMIGYKVIVTKNRDECLIKENNTEFLFVTNEQVKEKYSLPTAFKEYSQLL